MTGSRFPVVIYHNPDCGTSRNALALIRATGSEPDVVEYLKSGWTRGHLQGLFAAAGVSPREALREKEAATLAPQLLVGDVSDDTILVAMIAHPVLVQRPFVASPKGVRLCRPKSEAVLNLMDRGLAADFIKEDGQVIPATLS